VKEKYIIGIGLVVLFVCFGLLAVTYIPPDTPYIQVGTAYKWTGNPSNITVGNQSFLVNNGDFFTVNGTEKIIVP
jgi:hypothetical protein